MDSQTVIRLQETGYLNLRLRKKGEGRARSTELRDQNEVSSGTGRVHFRADGKRHSVVARCARNTRNVCFHQSCIRKSGEGGCRVPYQGGGRKLSAYAGFAKCRRERREVAADLEDGGGGYTYDARSSSIE